MATVRGWWIPLWLESHPIDTVTNVMTNLLDMIAAARLTPPETKSVPLAQYKEAIAMADGGSSEGKKILLKFSEANAKDYSQTAIEVPSHEFVEAIS